MPAEGAPKIGWFTDRLRVILTPRALTGPMFTRTERYAGGEIDVIARGVIPGGDAPAEAARLQVGLALRGGGGQADAERAFAPYR